MYFLLKETSVNCSCCYLEKVFTFSSALVSLLAELRKKKYSADFHKIRWKGAWKKQLDFDGNPDHVRLELELGLR